MSDAIKNKKKLVKELESCFKKLDLQRLYIYPDQEDTKDWLADVAAILKNLDETDYQIFQNYKQHLYSVMLLPIRKRAAQQIEGFVREKIATWKRYRFEDAKESSTTYVRQEIIEGFIKKQGKFNYKKLIRLMTELNSVFVSGYPYASSMLIRGILDHIPPLFGCETFEQVVSNHSWGRTDKKYMKGLFEFKKEGDDALHRQISEKEDLLDINDIPSSVRLNRLLQECLSVAGKKKIKKQELIKKRDKGINIKLTEGSAARWANFASDHRVWSSFELFLEVDNFNSKKPDFIGVALYGKTLDGNEWIGNHFHFELSDGQDSEYKIKAEDVKKVRVLISNHNYDGQTRIPMPSINNNGLTLIAKTKSGKEFNISIPKDRIVKS